MPLPGLEPWSKFDDEETRDLILQARANGLTKTASAEAGGISVKTLNRWLKQGEAENEEGLDTEKAEFYRRFKRARYEAMKPAIEVMLQAMREDWKAAKAWLQMLGFGADRDPEEDTHKTLNNQGQVNVIRVETGPPLPKPEPPTIDVTPRPRLAQPRDEEE